MGRPLNSRYGLKNLKAQQEARGYPDPEDRALIRIGKAATAVLLGNDDLSEWDEEELRRGQRRDKNGRFQGAPPKVIPKAVHDEMVKRTLAEAEAMLTDALKPAIEMLRSIIDDPEAEDGAKIKAISMVMDRVMGKVPDKANVTVGQDEPWKQVLLTGAVSVPDPPTAANQSGAAAESSGELNDPDILDADLVETE